jgi:hypothetical protein
MIVRRFARPLRNLLLISKQFFVNQLAEDVPRQNVGFLNSWSLIAGDADAVVDLVTQFAATLSGESDRNQLFLPSESDSLENV